MFEVPAPVMTHKVRELTVRRAYGEPCDARDGILAFLAEFEAKNLDAQSRRYFQRLEGASGNKP